MIVRFSATLSVVLALGSLAAGDAAEPGKSSLLASTAVDAGRKSVPEKCTVRHDANGWWFVSPEGKRIFSLGVSVVNQGTSREEYDPARPSYAAWRLYDEPAQWSTTTLRRLKSWGFTTIGGWSDLASLHKSPEHNLWLMPVVSLGAQAGAPWWDMWDEKNLRRMDQIAQESIAPLCDDPRIIGYYSDNEIGWWDGALWRLTFEQASTSEQRKRLIKLLRDNYQNDWDALIKDFESDHANNWQELEVGGRLWHRPGGNGIRVSREFLGIMADRYYRLMRQLVRKHDPNALYLGDRYQSFYYPEVARACGRHVDVVSTNLNANWSDGTFLRSYLDTLHALTGKPILVSEFYMAATDNRSGNKNTNNGFPVVGTQPERATALCNTARELARLPYVVGAEWFQYYDEPPHGRFDGEDYNFGLVDIHDQPYEEVTKAIASLNLPKIRAASGNTLPDASSGVPPAPPIPWPILSLCGRSNHGIASEVSFRPYPSIRPEICTSAGVRKQSIWQSMCWMLSTSSTTVTTRYPCPIAVNGASRRPTQPLSPFEWVTVTHRNSAIRLFVTNPFPA